MGGTFLLELCVSKSCLCQSIHVLNAHVYLLIRQVFPTARSPTTITLEILNLTKEEKAGTEELTQRLKSSLPPPQQSLLSSPHGSSTLLLTGCLDFVVKIPLCVQSCVFPKTLKAKRGGQACENGNPLSESVFLLFL